MTTPDSVALELVDVDVAACRVCGCTEDDPCEGGCWWAGDEEQIAAGLDPMTGDLCTACLPPATADRQVYLAAPATGSPRRYDLTREWFTNPLAGAIVTTRHPDPNVGTLRRGTVRPDRSGQVDAAPLGVWRLASYDHEDLGLVVGDYVDAELALLAATAELDAPTSGPEPMGVL